MAVDQSVIPGEVRSTVVLRIKGMPFEASHFLWAFIKDLRGRVLRCRISEQKPIEGERPLLGLSNGEAALLEKCTVEGVGSLWRRDYFVLVGCPGNSDEKEIIRVIREAIKSYFSNFEFDIDVEIIEDPEKDSSLQQTFLEAVGGPVLLSKADEEEMAIARHFAEICCGDREVLFRLALSILRSRRESGARLSPHFSGG